MCIQQGGRDREREHLASVVCLLQNYKPPPTYRLRRLPNLESKLQFHITTIPSWRD